MSVLSKINGVWKVTGKNVYTRGRVEVGFVMAYAGANDPESGNWLLLDGRDTTGTEIELATKYPKLYKFLGNTNVLPDYRECTIKMPGSNPQGAAHNPIALGAFQDDRGQAHTHTMAHTHTRGTMEITGGQFGACMWGYPNYPGGGAIVLEDTPNANSGTAQRGAKENVYHFQGSRGWTGETSQPSAANTGAASSRTGDTTEVKAVGLNYIICAR